MGRRRAGARIAIVGAALGAVTVVLPREARADGTSGFLTPGFLLSFVGGRNGATGVGAELSYMHYDPGRDMIGAGPFVQAQTYFHSQRYAFGVEGGGPLGAELGAAYRTADEVHAPQWGVHLALYGSIGLLSVGLRGTIPIGGALDGEPRQGGEIACVLKLGLPIPLYGSEHFGPSFGNFGSGRGLRDGDGVIVADVVVREEWPEGSQPFVAEIDASTRARLAEEWLADASLEHASIAAFHRLADELARVEAPSRLVARANEAARDEIDHARRCFAIASAYMGCPLGPGPMRAPSSRAADLAIMAVESFVDGALGEGAAAKIAKWSAVRAEDSAVREALEVIARDEARHAELAWDVLEYAVATSAAARAALEAVLDPSVEEDVASEPSGASLEAVLADHGRAPLHVVRRIRSSVRRASFARARALLSRLTDRRRTSARDCACSDIRAGALPA